MCIIYTEFYTYTEYYTYTHTCGGGSAVDVYWIYHILYIEFIYIVYIYTHYLLNFTHVLPEKVEGLLPFGFRQDGP